MGLGLHNRVGLHKEHGGSDYGIKSKYRDRRVETIEAAVRRTDAWIAHNAQHGRVRILMVDGQPGPDA